MAQYSLFVLKVPLNTNKTKHNSSNICLLALYNLVKPVPECQANLDFAAARDGGGGSGANQNAKF